MDFFGFLDLSGSWLKTLYGYWRGHTSLVEVAGSNVAIIKAQKCTQTDINYMHMHGDDKINDDLPYLIFSNM